MPLLKFADANKRITISIEIEGVATTAILDTGAPYSICEPEIARELGFDSADAIEDIKISTWGGKVNGSIHRVNLSLPADEGTSLSLDAPVFVPDLDQDFAPGFPPSFLGLIGCLQSMRFAIDPSSENFYFMASPR